MKKPNFIEIRLPVSKSTIMSASRGYFRRLEGKVLNVNFGERKERKIFIYTVVKSDLVEAWSYYPRAKNAYYSLRLELKVPKEDPNKVL
jgi:hypothetical protein